MKIEFIDNVPHITPGTQEEEDQLFDWYEKQGQKRVDSVISFEWLPRAKAKSSDEMGDCNMPRVSGSASKNPLDYLGSLKSDAFKSRHYR